MTKWYTMTFKRPVAQQRKGECPFWRPMIEDDLRKIPARCWISAKILCKSGRFDTRPKACMLQEDDPLF